MASEKVDRFVEMLAPAAIEIGARYGLDPALIISQSALETGWGDSVAGNNYFGVKSHGQPGGRMVSTHEEVNGRMVPVTDSFRQYGGVVESMEDYARFLRDNPRYSDVFNRQGVNDQIDAVAAAGYATDSGYADKLKAVAQMFDLSPYGQAQPPSSLMAYNSRLPSIGPTGGPALNAINRAAPSMPTPAVMRPGGRPANGGMWSALLSPVRSAVSMAGAPVMRSAANPRVQQQAVGNLMGTVSGRTAIMRALMAGNTAPRPSPDQLPAFRTAFEYTSASGFGSDASSPYQRSTSISG